MAKDYTLSSMSDILLRIKIPAEKQNTTTKEIDYHAAMLRCSARARNGKASAPIVLDDIYLGAAKSVPWTNNEIWTAVNNADLNTIFANALRDLYQEGINEDITT